MRPLRQIRPLFLVDEPRSKTIFSHHCGKIYGIRFITNITIVIAMAALLGNNVEEVEVPEFFRPLRSSSRSTGLSFNDYEKREDVMTVVEKQW